MNWSNQASWTANSGFPGQSGTTDNVFSSGGTNAILNVTGDYTINNLTATEAWVISAPTSPRLLTINGQVQKTGTGNLAFQNGSSTLSLALGQVSVSASSAAGGIFFGVAGTQLNSLSATGMTLTSNTANTVSLGLNVTNDASVGVLSFDGSGAGQRIFYLLNSSATRTTTVTTSGISGTTTSASRILGGVNATSGTHNATLNINTVGNYSTNAVLENGTTGLLIVEKNGNGVQRLAGASTYTGGTTVKAGTLLVNNTTGSGLGTGTVVVNGTGKLGGTGAIVLAANQNVQIATGGTLLVGDVTDIAASIFSITTSGTGKFSLDSGAYISLDVWTTSTIDRLVLSGDINLAGNLVVNNPNAVSFTAGATLDLFDWGAGTLTGAFNQIDLSAIGGNSMWNLTNLYTTGVIVAVPEPQTNLLLVIGAVTLLAFRRRMLCAA